MADGRPSTPARPRWSQILRALREARGVTQEGWAAILGVGVNTVGRGESGTAVPNALAEQEIIAACRERGLFRAYAEGPLGGPELTPDRLSDLLAEARLHAGPVRRTDENEARPGAPVHGVSERSAALERSTVAAPSSVVSTHLPAPPTPLVGREQDRVRLLTRLNDPACRLVTVIGMGGIGKTRLALQVAADLLPTHDGSSPFVHGVAFVPLTAVVAREPLDDALATAIASALDFALSGRGTPAVEIVQYLRERSLLLVLDDVEHLAAAGPFLLTLLQEAPTLKILATSRGRLNVRGEWVVDLPGLDVPADDEPETGSDLLRFSAIELFVRTAQTLAPDFALSPENGPAVQRICRFVAGLPLGIELAASWIRLLTCEEIADEIQQSIDFLAADLQDVPARHRSLRAVFTTSWERLSAEDQQALRQLAIFLGSFTREPAAAVAGATLPRLAALVDRSLVRPYATAGARTGGPARYELLAPVRQYAAEYLVQSGEAERTTARHAAYYLTFLEERLPDLRGPRQREALAQIGAEIAQVRLAWQWAVERAEPAAIARATDSLFHFYDIQSWFREGADAFLAAARALEARPADPETARARGKALARHGWFTFHLGRQQEAKRLLDQSLEILREAGAPAELVFPLNYLGAVESYLGNTARTQTLCQEALTIAGGVGDAYGRAIGCNILGQTAYQRGEYPAARAWSEQSLEIEQRLGNRWSMAYSLTNLGRVAYALGEYAEARRLVGDCLAVREELGDVRGVALCLSQLGTITLALGDTGEAAESFTRSYGLSREIGNPWGMTAALIDLSGIATAAERDPLAARLLHEALRLALASGIGPQVLAISTACVPLARRHGDAAWADDLAHLVDEADDGPDRFRESATRLLAWTGSLAPADLTLEDAVAAVRDVARGLPPPSTTPIAERGSPPIP